MSIIPKEDTYAANVKLLLPFDEDLTDYSGTPKTVTAAGNAAVSATQTKYGAKSCYFDGTDDYLTAGVAADWTSLHVTGAKWTVELWSRVADYSSARMLFSTSNASSANVGVHANITTSRTVIFGVSRGEGGVSVCAGIFSGVIPDDSAFHHIAITYDHTLAADNATLWIDGVASGTLSKTANAPSAAAPTAALQLGGFGTTGTYLGYMDEVRITDTIVRYTEAFTPPGTFFNTTYANTIVESVTATVTGASRCLLMDTLLEVLSSTSESSATGGHGIVDALVEEYLSMSGPTVSGGLLQSVVSETSTVTDTTAGRATMYAAGSETVTATTLILAPYIERLFETLTMTATPVGGGKFQRVCMETARLQGIITPAWVKVISEQITMTATAARRFEVAVALVERLTVSEAVPSRLHAIMTVALSVVVSDQAAAGKGATVSETTTLTATLLNRLYAVARALDTATMTSTAAMTLRLSLPVTETAALTSTFSATAKLRDLITEGVAFELSFNTGETTYTGWVMNTKNFAVTEYQNFPFNSFAKVGNTYLGANTQGLYQLTGDTDAGDAIEATMTLGITDLASDKLKRLDSIYLGFRTNGSIVLKILTEANIEYWYEAKVTMEKFHQNRVKVSRAIEAVTWQLTLVNTDGADFELKTVEFVPVILSRRT